jgi:hypothetical protein
MYILTIVYVVYDFTLDTSVTINDVVVIKHMAIYFYFLEMCNRVS